MEGHFNKMINTVYSLEDRENSSSDNSGGSSPSTARTSNIHSVSSSKTRRGIEKKVVRIPIKGGECSISTTPPSDSWAWRKYGQKPIKGSPYPRGYYRCSSSKGCPARKQVERSRSDPTLLLVTYSYDHNHSFPVARNNNHHKPPPPPPPATQDTPSQIGFKIETRQPSVTTTDDFDWSFPDMETTSSAILDHPIFSNSTASLSEDDYFRPPLMAADEESLFADLGELPECSVVFGSF